MSRYVAIGAICGFLLTVLVLWGLGRQTEPPATGAAPTAAAETADAGVAPVRAPTVIMHRKLPQRALELGDAPQLQLQPGAPGEQAR